MMLRAIQGLSAGAAQYFTRTPPGVYVVALAIPAFAVAVALLGGLAPAEVLRDPLLAAGAPVEHFHLGFFSNLGVVAWTVAGSICLFTAVGGAAGLHPRAREFLFYAGVFSLVVMFDDLS